jgi:hypothetical protein
MPQRYTVRGSSLADCNAFSLSLGVGRAEGRGENLWKPRRRKARSRKRRMDKTRVKTTAMTDISECETNGATREIMVAAKWGVSRIVCELDKRMDCKKGWLQEECYTSRVWGCEMGMWGWWDEWWML